MVQPDLQGVDKWLAEAELVEAKAGQPPEIQRTV